MVVDDCDVVVGIIAIFETYHKSGLLSENTVSFFPSFCLVKFINFGDFGEVFGTFSSCSLEVEAIGDSIEMILEVEAYGISVSRSVNTVSFFTSLILISLEYTYAFLIFCWKDFSLFWWGKKCSSDTACWRV